MSMSRNSKDTRQMDTSSSRGGESVMWDTAGNRGGQRVGRGDVSEPRNSRVEESHDVGGWSLPFRSNCPYALPPQIASEFKRLDLTGEGRLTYLTLKSALELREVSVDDGTLRRWLKESDRGSKGYVDFNDYCSIYSDFQEGGAGAVTGTGMFDRNRGGTLRGQSLSSERTLGLERDTGDGGRRQLLRRLATSPYLIISYCISSHIILSHCTALF
jgi:EF-hand domain pair